jgi:DNA-directed RNA polymerase subunit delta
MSKRRAIISYDKLTIDQKKQILKDYPDGYINHLTSIKTPTGEVLDALIWETEEVIYLVKINKLTPKAKPVVDDEEDDFEDDFDKVPGIKDDELDENDDDEEDEYDQPDDEDDEDDED